MTAGAQATAKRGVTITCTKNVPGLCPRVATELLLVSTVHDGEWLCKPRCDQHRASDDVDLLEQLSGLYQWAVVPLDLLVEASR